MLRSDLKWIGPRVASVVSLNAGRCLTQCRFDLNVLEPLSTQRLRRPAQPRSRHTERPEGLRGAGRLPSKPPLDRQGEELPIQTLLHPQRAQQLHADQQTVLQTVQRLIQDRRSTGAVGTINDLLDRMLTGIDRQSGEKLNDTNIMAQCITFLVAGHETTSGLLSFALYELIKHPEVLARAYDEVDRVLGTDLSVLPTYAQTHQVPYIAQILDETLRIWPTAPAFTRHPYENTVIGGKYQLRKDDIALIPVPMLHRDKHIWGENPEQFDPDHFSPENRSKIPPNAYKPFGTGQRLHWPAVRVAGSHARAVHDPAAI